MTKPFKCKPGDIIENGHAGEKNPHRYGMVLRKFTRRGRLNPGPHIVLTDGRGNTWELLTRPSYGYECRLRVVGHVDIAAAIRMTQPTSKEGN